MDPFEAAECPAGKPWRTGTVACVPSRTFLCVKEIYGPAFNHPISEEKMLGLCASLIRRLIAAHEHRKARIALTEMSDDLLRDIGIDRGAIESAIRNGRGAGFADART